MTTEVTKTEAPGDTTVEYTAADAAAAREYLGENDVDVKGMDDAAIVSAAIAALSVAGTAKVSPGEPKMTPAEKKAHDEAGVTKADLEAKIKAGDGIAILAAYEKIAAERETDKQTIAAISGAVSNLVTKAVLTPLKGDYPDVTSKAVVEKIQAKATILLQTGEYEIEDALLDAAHLICGRTGKKTPTEPAQNVGLATLRALKSAGSPSVKGVREAPEAQTYDEWADKIGRLVVDGRYDEAKVLRERGFTQAKK